MGSAENQGRVPSLISQAVCVSDAMETDTPRHQRASLGGTNDLTAGERRIPVLQGSTVTPGGFPQIPDNARPKLAAADATYFSIRQSGTSFQGFCFSAEAPVCVFEVETRRLSAVVPEKFRVYTEAF